jgi:hypothetical protein
MISFQLVNFFAEHSIIIQVSPGAIYRFDKSEIMPKKKQQIKSKTL